jgi:hypothetical protein
LREAVAHVYDHGSPIAVDLPLGLEAVRYAAEQARTTTVELFLDFTGFLRARTEASGQGQSTDVSPWVEADIDRAQGRVSIPRSDWISRAIEPFGTERFVFLEVPIPPPPDLKKWESALTHLKDAERLFREGHDAEVMQRCFAAFESLGARPQAIFNAEPDERKRAQLNESLLATKKFLHAGRHVSGAEELDREFAVDHRDAAFALAQTKVWISYVAHLLQGSAASGRRSGR